MVSGVDKLVAAASRLPPWSRRPRADRHPAGVGKPRGSSSSPATWSAWRSRRWARSPTRSWHETQEGSHDPLRKWRRAGGACLQARLCPVHHPDVQRLVHYYTKVLDFELVDEAPDGAFLTTGFDHHSV